MKPQEDKERCEERKKQMMVTVPVKLVVGFGELIPMESGSDNSENQDTATVTKDNEEPAAK